jgi:hypothetical protein
MENEDQAGFAPEAVDFGEPYGYTESRKNLERMLKGALEERLGPPHTVHQPLPAEPIALDELVHAPAATEAMLNAQLLECVGMVRDVGYLYRNSPMQPDDRSHFINHASRLMETSAKLAEAITRLRGAPEPVKTTRHVVAIEHVGGGGTPIPENE